MKYELIFFIRIQTMTGRGKLCTQPPSSPLFPNPKKSKLPQMVNVYLHISIIKEENLFRDATFKVMGGILSGATQNVANIRLHVPFIHLKKLWNN